jgi:hypothetical protein
MKKKRDLQRRAIDETRLSLDDMAEAVDMSRSSLARYRLLGRNRVRMPEYVAKRLADFLRQHASHLEEIADELDQVEDD